MQFQNVWSGGGMPPVKVASLLMRDGTLQVSVTAKCFMLNLVIQCLAKVFGPLELCDLLPHFRLQT
jgi:hypothetical protein